MMSLYCLLQKKILVLILLILSPMSFSRIEGYIDSATKNSKNGVDIKGWACNSGTSEQIQIHMYSATEDGAKRSWIGRGIANQSSESAVQKICKSNKSAHRFTMSLSYSQWSASSNQLIYIHGISPKGEPNLLIEKSGELRVPPLTIKLSQLRMANGNYMVKKGQNVVIDKSIRGEKLMVQGNLSCPNNTSSYRLSFKAISVMEGKFDCGTKLNRFKGKLDIHLREGLESKMGNHNMGERTFSIMNGGEVHFYGDMRRSNRARLAAHAHKGKQIIKLNRAVLWSKGDVITITSTGFDMNEAESFTIKSISNNRKEITLNKQLQHFHYGNPGKRYNSKGKTYHYNPRAYVANLTRNIQVRSAEGSYRQNELGAHMMAMHGGKAYIDAVEFISMGQKGKMGRYPFHWHKLGNVNGQFIRNSSIRNSFQRCIVIHDSNYAEVSNNTCFNHFGHGIFLEDGSERKNTITNNLVIGSKKIQKSKALLRSEVVGVAFRFPAPASYWISNPDNRVEGNIASGSQGSGFWMAFHADKECNDGMCSNVPPRQINTLSFKNNNAHSTQVGFTWDGAPNGGYTKNPLNENDRFIINTHYAPGQTKSKKDKPVFDKLVAYKNTQSGVYYRGNAASFTNSIIADNRLGLFFAYSQHVKDSAIIGYSGIYSNNDKAFFSKANTEETNKGGIVIYDGPFELEDVTFFDFPKQVNDYGTGHLSPIPITNIGGANRFENKVKGLRFVPEPRKRVEFSNLPSRWHDSKMSLMIRDIDGSLTGISNSLVVHNSQFNNHHSCKINYSWNAKICKYDQFLIFIQSNLTKTNNFNHFMVTKMPNNVSPFKDQFALKNHYDEDSGRYVKSLYNKFVGIRGFGGYYDLDIDNSFKSSFTIRLQAEDKNTLSSIVKISDQRCTVKYGSRSLASLRSYNELKSSKDHGLFISNQGTYFKLKTSMRYPSHTHAEFSKIYYGKYDFTCD